jgi:hypothetical protein
VDEAKGLASLDVALREACAQPQRRIDRFIQLALIGSARCAKGVSLSERCAVIVATGVGPVGNNIIVQETLLRERLLPKPFHFVNTLGSSSGYYVSKNLGLSGEAQFVSRRRGALDAALACALTQLQGGLAKQVLLGVVEECTLPLIEHRRRQLLGVGETLAEGSHWFLLESSLPGPGRIVSEAFFEDRKSILEFLQRSWKSSDRLFFSPALEPAERLPFGAFETLQESDVWHDSLDAAQLSAALGEANSGSLYWLGRGGEKAWKLWKFLNSAP